MLILNYLNCLPSKNYWYIPKTGDLDLDLQGQIDL